MYRQSPWQGAAPVRQNGQARRDESLMDMGRGWLYQACSNWQPVAPSICGRRRHRVRALPLLPPPNAQVRPPYHRRGDAQVAPGDESTPARIARVEAFSETARPAQAGESPSRHHVESLVVSAPVFENLRQWYPWLRKQSPIDPFLLL